MLAQEAQRPNIPFVWQSRAAFQTSKDAARWQFLSGLLCEYGLVHQDVGVEFSRRSAREEHNDSLIDHIFAGNRALMSCGASWDGAPGDHCWLKWSTPFRTEWRKQPPRR